MKKLLSISSLNTDIATLMLRLIFGGLFIYHGFSKILAYNDILPKFGDIIGIGSTLSFNLVIFAEFGCGIFVTIGLLTRLTVLPISFTMIVAFFIAHANDPFARKELALIFLLLSVVIFILGSGKYSIDKLLFKKKYE